MMKTIVESAVLGAAVGDALGVPYEFLSRSDMANNPAKTMIGNGTYRQPAGTWSDDTSMILATMDGLCGGLDYNRVMDNFVLWLEKGQFTPHDVRFDVGITTYNAVKTYEYTGTSPLLCGENHVRSNGNGSLMRILPFALFCLLKDKNAVLDDETVTIIHDASRLTHAHLRSQMACGIYASIIFELVRDPQIQSIEEGLKKAFFYYSGMEEYAVELQTFSRLFGEDVSSLPMDEISGSGYVVHSLEAAVWCALTTDSYEESVLKAVNLGEDTDTVACITGGMTGILYGKDDIPADWLDSLVRLDMIQGLCDTFVESV